MGSSTLLPKCTDILQIGLDENVKETGTHTSKIKLVRSMTVLWMYQTSQLQYFTRTAKAYLPVVLSVDAAKSAASKDFARGDLAQSKTPDENYNIR